jgi:hypothetical protein
MRFGKDLVFQDIEDIKPGEDFLQDVRRAIESAEVVLVIIGPEWTKGKLGQRLHQPRDVVRQEVALSLNSTATVIPILVGGAGMPLADQLPQSIKKLSTRNAATLRDSRWRVDIASLIERIRELLAATRDQYSLPQVYQELNQAQLRFFEILTDNAAAALEFAQKILAYLDHVMPLYPQDPYLQVVRGYFFKNEALALSRLNRVPETEAALSEAERVFGTMIQERPNDAGAWNGLGSVAATRGNYKQALKYIDRALKFAPTYEAARQDREEVLKYLGVEPPAQKKQVRRR